MKDLLSRLLPRISRMHSLEQDADSLLPGMSVPDHNPSAPRSEGTWFGKLRSESPSTGAATSIPANNLWDEVSQRAMQHSRPAFGGLPIGLCIRARIGGLLHGERNNLDGHALHLSCQGILVAVFDSVGLKLCIRDDLQSIHSLTVTMSRMPANARSMPPGFVGLSLREAVWLYGLHDPEALLDVPRTMATYPIQLRKLPLVDAALVNDTQLRILRVLMGQTLNFEGLCEALNREDGIEPWQLCHPLAALLLTHSVKLTSPQQA
jgi:hypothetical protein